MKFIRKIFNIQFNKIIKRKYCSCLGGDSSESYISQRDELEKMEKDLCEVRSYIAWLHWKGCREVSEGNPTYFQKIINDHHKHRLGDFEELIEQKNDERNEK